MSSIELSTSLLNIMKSTMFIQSRFYPREVENLKCWENKYKFYYTLGLFNAKILDSIYKADSSIAVICCTRYENRKKKRRSIMTDENKAILKRINDYAEEVMGDIDPQKVPVSTQLENLRPIMEKIAKEKGKRLEDIFILYLDLQSEASSLSDRKLQDSLKDLNDGDGSPLLYR